MIRDSAQQGSLEPQKMFICSKPDHWDNPFTTSSMSEFQLLHAIRLDIFLAVLIAAVMAKLYLRSRRGSHLPPGPPTTPFIGNLLSLSQSTPYIQYGIWAQQYGEIFSLKAGPSGTIVVMNSPQAIHEIMEKQGMASAGRPHQVVGERCTGGFMVGMNQPSEWIVNGRNMLFDTMRQIIDHYWKRARRAVAEMTKPEECSKHLLIQIAESNQLMFDAMNSPQVNSHFHLRPLATCSTLL